MIRYQGQLKRIIKTKIHGALFAPWIHNSCT